MNSQPATIPAENIDARASGTDESSKKPSVESETAPQPRAPLAVTHSDGSTFSDGSGYSQ